MVKVIGKVLFIGIVTITMHIPNKAAVYEFGCPIECGIRTWNCQYWEFFTCDQVICTTGNESEYGNCYTKK